MLDIVAKIVVFWWPDNAKNSVKKLVGIVIGPEKVGQGRLQAAGPVRIQEGVRIFPQTFHNLKLKIL